MAMSQDEFDELQLNKSLQEDESIDKSSEKTQFQKHKTTLRSGKSLSGPVHKVKTEKGTGGGNAGTGHVDFERGTGGGNAGTGGC